MRLAYLQTAGVLLALMPGATSAHGFGQLYNLPVPLWLYGWAAAATLILSFVVAALFLSATPRSGGPASLDLRGRPWLEALRSLVTPLRGLALFVLLLCLATGYLGHRDPLRNFSLTFFWVIFVLLFTYLTVLVGNFYAALNPWHTLAALAERCRQGFTRAHPVSGLAGRLACAAAVSGLHLVRAVRDRPAQAAGQLSHRLYTAEPVRRVADRCTCLVSSRRVVFRVLPPGRADGPDRLPARNGR